MQGNRHQGDVAQVQRRRSVDREHARQRTAGDPLAGVLEAVQQASCRARLGP